MARMATDCRRYREQRAQQSVRYGQRPQHIDYFGRSGCPIVYSSMAVMAGTGRARSFSNLARGG